MTLSYSNVQYVTTAKKYAKSSNSIQKNLEVQPIQRKIIDRNYLQEWLPGRLSGKEFSCQYRRLRFNPSVSQSVSQFSCSVMSDSLRPHESQQARPPCLSPTPRVYPNQFPSSQWYHPAISSSVVPFSSCPQSLPASGSFPMSIQVWFPLGLTGFNSLQSKGLLSSPNHSSKASILWR